MSVPSFRPGVRLSQLDCVVLAIAAVAAVGAWQIQWWLGFVFGYVTGHFFLFCNIVRMSRAMELAWAGVFVALAGSTIVAESPGWSLTVLVSLVTTLVLVIIEMRRPSYHGIAWQQINPNLKGWWEEHVGKSHQPTGIE
jgi:hypothetical protein